MGVVRRQTIKNNILSVVGIVIGVVSHTYIFPMNLELKGLIEGLIGLVGMFAPFLTLAVGGMIVRILPYVELEKTVAGNRLLSRSLLLVSVGVLVFLGLVWLFSEHFFQWLQGKGFDLSAVFMYKWQILVILICAIYSDIFTRYLYVFQRVAVPVIFNILLPKVTIPALILLNVYGSLARPGVVWGITGLYLTGLVCLIGYCWKVGSLKIDFGPLVFRGKSYRDVADYIIFGLIGTAGVALSLNLDRLLVWTYLGEQEIAVYAFGIFVVGIMYLPYKAVLGVSSHLIATKFKERKIAELAVMYRDSSETLFAIGGVVFLGTISCLPFYYQLTTNLGQYELGHVALIILGVGVLFDLMTGINTSMVSYSDHYRWNTVFVVLLGGGNVAISYWMVVVLQMGLIGAALGTTITLIAVNLVKIGFIYWKLKAQPFGWPHLYILLILLAVGGITTFFPNTGMPLPDLLLKGTLVVVLSYVCFRYTSASGYVRDTMIVLEDGVKKQLKGIGRRKTPEE